MFFELQQLVEYPSIVLGKAFLSSVFPILLFAAPMIAIRGSQGEIDKWHVWLALILALSLSALAYLQFDSGLDSFGDALIVIVLNLVIFFVASLCIIPLLYCIDYVDSIFRKNSVLEKPRKTNLKENNPIQIAVIILTACSMSAAGLLGVVVWGFDGLDVKLLTY